MIKEVDDFTLLRLISSIKNAVRRTNLDLRGRVVITECATEAYSCTPGIAALAGAKKVVAFGKDTSYGTFRAAREDVLFLWRALGLSQEVLLATDSLDVLDENLRKADIVTNSGHLRPLNAERIKNMRRGCVIPLMYESWEFRHTDLSLKACQKYGIPVAGTNERFPEIGVFDYLGPVVAKSLFNVGLEVVGNNILLICDNDFVHYIEETLQNMGANVLSKTYSPKIHIDAIVFAHTPPESGGTLDIQSLDLPQTVPVCCQLWGNVNRSHFQTTWIPEKEPATGHMGLMLSSLGVEPLVKLQAGSLKVAELLWRACFKGADIHEAVEAVVQSKWGQKLVE